MKNVKKIIILWIICMIIGCVIGTSIAYYEQNNFIMINNEYFQNSFLLNIFILIVAYILSIALHELTHLFAFVIQKIRIRAVIILGCVFIKENNKWKFKFKISLMKALGGIVIPNYSVVKDEQEFNILRKKMANSIVAAPIVSALLGLLSLLTGIISLKVVPLSMKSTIFMFMCGMVIFSIIITISCFCQNEYVLGDFAAYKVIKDNDFFAAIQIYEYGIFSEDQHNVRKNSIFLRNLILKELELKLSDESQDSSAIGVVDEIIQEYLIGIIEEVPEVIKKYILFIVENKESIINSTSNTTNLGIIIRIIYLLNKLDEKDKAIELYNFVYSNIGKSVEHRYYKKQLEHVLDIANNKEYLTNKNNIKTNGLSALWELFDVYYEDEMRISGVLENFNK